MGSFNWSLLTVAGGRQLFVLTELSLPECEDSLKEWFNCLLHLIGVEVDFGGKCLCDPPTTDDDGPGGSEDKLSFCVEVKAICGKNSRSSWRERFLLDAVAENYCSRNTQQ